MKKKKRSKVLGLVCCAALTIGVVGCAKKEEGRSTHQSGQRLALAFAEIAKKMIGGEK